MATQITTAVCKLVYKWFNDGDIFDTTYYLTRGCNDLSSYANWLYIFAPEAREILDGITECRTFGDYDDLLYRLCEKCQKMDYLSEYAKKDKIGSIYECEGKFEYVDYEYEYDGDDDYEDYLEERRQHKW